MKKSIINKTIQGIRWNFKSQLFTQLINFIVGIILMRLIAPEEFGKFAMVLVIISFLQFFRDFGLTAALIQKKEITAKISSSVFWFHIIIGTAIGGIIFLAAQGFDTFYQAEGLAPIAIWLGLDFFIGSIGLVPMALLSKELKFKSIFYIQFAGTIVSTGIALFMAYQGMGVYSLVGKLLCWSALLSFGALLTGHWKPQFSFALPEIRRLMAFGLPATGNQLLTFLVRNTDDFFIGRVLGANALGFYNRAYALMLLPLGNITSVLRGVLYPAWSKIQDQVGQIKDMYLRVSGIIAFIAFPAMLLLSIFAEPIIVIILGNNWVPMSGTLKVLSLVGLIQSVGSMVGVIFMVFNKNSLLLKINVCTSIIMISGIIWSVYTFQAIETTAMVYGLISFSFLFPTFYFTGKLLNASLVEMFQPLLVPLGLAILATTCAWALFHYLPIQSIFIKLSFSLILASIIYLGLAFFYNIRSIRDLKSGWKNLLASPNKV